MPFLTQFEEAQINHSDYYIVDGLIVHGRKRTVHHYSIKPLEELQSHIPSGVIEQYDLWDDLPDNSVIPWDVRNLTRYGFQTKKYCILPQQDPDSLPLASSRGSTAKADLFTYRRNGRYRHFDQCTIERTPNQFAQMGYRDSCNNSPPEASNALESTYHIYRFKATISKMFEELPEIDFVPYSTEITQILLHCFVQYLKRTPSLQLSVTRSFDSKVQTVMGTHKGGTFVRYCSILRNVIYVVVNMKRFQKEFAIEDDVVVMCEKFREGFGLLPVDLTGENIDLPFLQDRVRQFQAIMWRIITDRAEVMFTLPLKFSMLDLKTGNVMNLQYCLKVMNSYKFMLRYLFMYDPEQNLREIPENFQTVFGEQSIPAYSSLKKVFSDVFKAADFITDYRTSIDSENNVTLNGISFSKAIIKRYYNTLKSEYHIAVSDLRTYGIQLPTVDAIVALKLDDFVESNKQIYTQFIPDGSCHHMRGVEVHLERLSDRDKDNLYRILQTFSEVMSSLMYISSGGMMRLFELNRVAFDGSDSKISMSQMESSFYHMYCETKQNKNNSNNSRIFFANSEITRLFIHYVLCVYPLKQCCMAELDVLPSIRDTRLHLLTIDCDIEDLFGLNYSGLSSSRDVLNKYLFAIPVKSHKVWYAGLLTSDYCTRRLKNILGYEYTFTKMRQVFKSYNEIARNSMVLDYADNVNAILAQNSGHSTLTAIRNYGYDHDKTETCRLSAFTVSYALMSTVNRFLGLEEEREITHAILPLPPTDPTQLTINEMLKAHSVVYPGVKFREKQELCLAGLGACTGTYALQAPTGFGKTMLFTTVLRAINLKNRNMINVILVPYSALHADLKKRLRHLGFTIKDVGAISHDRVRKVYADVYTGVYDSLVNSGLDLASSELGFLVLDEAHCIKSEEDFRPILQNLAAYHLNAFKKVFITSATLPDVEAEEIYSKLNLRHRPFYQSVVSDYPHAGRVHICQYDYTVCRGGPIASLVALLERFLAFSEDQKVVVFVDRIATVEKIKKEFPSGIYIHSKCQDKDGLVNEFTTIKSQRVLIGTKLISNGIDVADVTMVVFFKHNPPPIDFIQGLGRIRGKGLCLMFNDKFVCPSLALSQFYDLPYRNHVCCCGAPIENEEVSDLYNAVVSANFETTQHDSEEEIQETGGGCTSPLVLPDFSPIQHSSVACLPLDKSTPGGQLRPLSPKNSPADPLDDCLQSDFGGFLVESTPSGPPREVFSPVVKCPLTDSVFVEKKQASFDDFSGFLVPSSPNVFPDNEDISLIIANARPAFHPPILRTPKNQSGSRVMRTPSINRSARFSPYVVPTPKAEKFRFGIEGLEEAQQLCPLYGAFRNMNFSPENRRLFDPLENDPLFQVCLLEMFTVMNLKECALTEEVLMLYIHVFLLVFVGDMDQRAMIDVSASDVCRLKLKVGKKCMLAYKQLSRNLLSELKKGCLIAAAGEVWRRSLTLDKGSLSSTDSDFDGPMRQWLLLRDILKAVPTLKVPGICPKCFCDENATHCDPDHDARKAKVVLLESFMNKKVPRCISVRLKGLAQIPMFSVYVCLCLCACDDDGGPFVHRLAL